MSRANLRIQFVCALCYVFNPPPSAVYRKPKKVILGIACDATLRVVVNNYCNNTTTRALNCRHQSFIMKQTTLAPRGQPLELLKNKAN